MCSWVLKANRKQQSQNTYRDDRLILYALYQSHNQFQYVAVCKCITVLHKSLPYITKFLWRKLLTIQLIIICKELKIKCFSGKVLVNPSSSQFTSIVLQDRLFRALSQQQYECQHGKSYPYTYHCCNSDLLHSNWCHTVSSSD